MLSALRIVLQEKKPQNHWKRLTSSQGGDEPAVILLIGDSSEEAESIRQSMMDLDIKYSALEEIDSGSIRTFLNRSFIKFPRAQPSFGDIETFKQWCEKIAIFFPAPLKSQDKKSKKLKKTTKSLGDQLIEASSCLYQEELYPALYEELQQLAPSNGYVSKTCLVKSDNSRFYIETHPEIKKVIENILAQYREWLKAENIFDVTLLDLSQRQYLPIRSKNKIKYTHVVWNSNEALSVNLKSYFEKVADAVVTYSPLTRALSVEEIFQQLDAALAEYKNGQPFFLDHVFQKIFLTTTFLLSALASARQSRHTLLYKAFYIDPALMAAALEVLNFSSKAFTKFMSFIFAFTENDNLINVLLKAFTKSRWPNRFLSNAVYLLVEVIKVLELGSPGQTRLLAGLLLSFNNRLNNIKFPEFTIFANRYGALLDCLEQKHGELDGSDSHKEISRLIFKFTCLFVEKTLKKKSHSVFVYEKVMKIFNNQENYSKDDLGIIMQAFKKIHTNFLMDPQLLTDNDFREINILDYEMWGRTQKVWDILRNLYATMIQLCSKITDFTGFSETTIQIYALFQEHLEMFSISARSKSYLPYANMYINVLQAFRAELEVAKKQGVMIAKEFFEKVLNFLINFPSDENWPDMCHAQIVCYQTFIFTCWSELLREGAIDDASAHYVWQKWQGFLENIAENKSMEVSDLVQDVEVSLSNLSVYTPAVVSSGLLLLSDAATADAFKKGSDASPELKNHTFTY